MCRWAGKMSWLLLLLIAVIDARLMFPSFYSDPSDLTLDKSTTLEDQKYQRLKSIRNSKWKRRRTTPIRITPFYYASSPTEFLDSSLAAARSRSFMSPFTFVG